MLLGSLAARRARVALALLAVTVGVAVATALATLALRVGDDLARTLRGTGPNFVVTAAGARWPLDLGGAAFEPARAGVALGDSVIPAFKTTFWKNNVLEAAPELTVGVRVNGAAAVLRGTWFAHDVPTADGPWTTGVARLEPTWRVDGRWPREDAGEIALGRDLATRLALRRGDTAQVACDGRTARLPIAGIVTASGLEDAGAWAPLSVAQRLAARPGDVDRVWASVLVRPAPRTPPPDPVRDPKGYERFSCAAYPANVARALSERVGADVQPLSERVAGEARVVERLNLLMLLLGLAALAASVLGLLSTTSATVVERRGELGLLRALGATSGQLATLLLGETLAVSLTGGVLGWGLGSLAALAIRGDSFGASGRAEPLLLPVAVLLAGAIAVLGTLGPLRLALRLEPTTVLRDHA
jgi:putative ABC transport system permease protein